MDFNKILSDLKNKDYYPVYLLEGEEPYFIDRISDYITANVLTEAEKGFNQTILYGKDTDIDTIISAARRFPMMSSRQVIVVREAQNLRNIEELVHYAENPLSSTLLVLNYKYKKLDKRKKLYKAVNKNGAYFEAKPLYENQIPAWINKYLKAQNFGIEPRAVQMISDHVGNNLKRIVNELEKVTISIPPGMSITTADVERNIGISKDFNTFELQTALGNKDVLKANRIVNYIAANPKMSPLPVVFGVLLSFFRKILIYHSSSEKTNKMAIARALGVNPYFMNDYIVAARNYNRMKAANAISLLREYDMRSKGARGGSTDNGDLLREMVFKLIHF
jgi:DNA polymerase-3 subunit delta